MLDRDPPGPVRSALLPLAHLFWNPQQRRLRALWRILLAFVFYQLLAGLFSALAFSAGASQLAPAASLPATVLTLGVAAWLLDRRRLRGFGLQMDRSWWLDLVFGLMLGALLMTFVFLVELAAGWIEIVEFWRTPQETPFLIALLTPLIIFFFVGIYEELLFRGYLMTNVAEGLNHPRLGGSRTAILLALLLTGGIFGLAHLSNPNATLISSAGIAAAGIFLGLGYAVTGRIALPIGLHITWNFFQGNVFGFRVSGIDFGQVTVFAIRQRGPEAWTGGAFGPEAGLVSIVATILGTLLILAWSRWRYGRSELRSKIAQPPHRRIAVVDETTP